MKKTNYSINYLLIICFASIFFTNCSKNEDNKAETPTEQKDTNADQPIKQDPTVPSNETIKIDDESSFNVQNFIKSFNQILNLKWKFKYSYKHEIINSKLAYSYRKNNLHGDFELQDTKYIHNYDPNGVIISSIRFDINNSIVDADADRSFTYKYDKNGYITKFCKRSGNFEPDNFIVISYDSKMRIIEQKIYQGNNEDNLLESYEFTYFDDSNYDPNDYNSTPRLKGISTFYNDNKKSGEYTYDYDNNMNLLKLNELAENGEIYKSRIYEYDNKNRLIKESQSNRDNFVSFEYSNDYISVNEFQSENIIFASNKYDKNNTLVEKVAFEYNGDDELTHYIRVEITPVYNCHNDQYPSKSTYMIGAIEDNKIQAYATTNKSKSDKNNVVIEFFDNKDKLLLYKTINYDNAIIRRTFHTPDGKEIGSDYNMEECIEALDYAHRL
ncbi:MAG: hypothetical protein N4A49_03850 [Marinifilaceae bacterium]|jgi:hypothetical protein|nr:hypothetical protein [Marinifilaceae bacterium]